MADAMGFSGRIGPCHTGSRLTESLQTPDMPRRPSARLSERARWKPYAWGLVAVLVPSAVGNLALRYLQLADLLMLHLLGVVIISLRFGPRPSLVTAICSVLAFDFFFIPPPFAFAAPDLKSTITFTVTVFVAAVISSLGERLRKQRVVASDNQRRAETLHHLSRDLAGTRELPQLADILRRHFVASYGGSCSVLLFGSGGTIQLAFGPRGQSEPGATMSIEDAYRVHVPASEVTLPLRTVRDTLGIVIVESPGIAQRLTRQELELLQACCDQTAIAIERALVAQSLERAEVAVESERVRSTLLAAIGHDLRTPLGVILTAANTLREHGDLKEDMRAELAGTIANQAEHLTQLVTNVVSMAKLESETLVVHKRPEAIEDVIGSAMTRCPGLALREVQLEIAENLPLVSVDAVLVEQLVLNLLENAVKYSPPASAVRISAAAAKGGVSVAVVDEGPGISEEEQAKVFEKFYRGTAAKARDGGVGLGLTICRAVVHAHAGSIRIRHRTGSGAHIEFWLPAEAQVSAASLAHEELPA